MCIDMNVNYLGQCVSSCGEEAPFQDYVFMMNEAGAQEQQMLCMAECPSNKYPDAVNRCQTC